VFHVILSSQGRTYYSALAGYGGWARAYDVRDKKHTQNVNGEVSRELSNWNTQTQIGGNKRWMELVQDYVTRRGLRIVN